jgi:monoamine oxidase
VSSGEFDVVVVGAGAAGLAAGKHLAGRASVLVVEARARTGGRAWTHVTGGFPVDLGCGWLHSADRNPFSGIAAELGFAIDKTPPRWGRQSGDVGFSAADQEAYRADLARLYERMAEAAGAPEDRAAAELLEPGGRWNALINSVSSFLNGAELDQVSVKDFDNYADSGVNWRVVEGYGTAIDAFGAGVNVALDTRVVGIDHSGSTIRLETDRGAISAKAVIVTVPTSILAAEAIRFTPALPDKAAAASVLPLGFDDKLFLGISEPQLLPSDGRYFGVTDSPTASYHVRPFGRPLIEAYFGGTLARDLEREGEAAFASFAVDQLAALLGNGIRPKLTPLIMHRWGCDPFALGSYSHALPGHSDARAVLASPVDGRLFFAGEACSPNDFSTAHGAYESGIAAAKSLCRARGWEHARY